MLLSSVGPIHCEPRFGRNQKGTSLLPCTPNLKDILRIVFRHPDVSHSSGGTESRDILDTLPFPKTRFFKSILVKLVPHDPLRYTRPIKRRYKSPRVSSLSKVIPQELFNIILFWVESECRKYEPDGRRHRRTLRRRSQVEVDFHIPMEDRVKHLKICSLVCRYWARLSRRSVFDDAILCISSLDEATFLVKSAKDGCTSLTPLLQLVSHISLTQGYDSTSYSFLHCIHITNALRCSRVGNDLTLLGPVPDRLPRHQTCTPHWSVPSSIPTPPSMLSFNRIFVENIRLPSFQYVMRYVRHLTQTQVGVKFWNLTWRDKTLDPPGLPSFIPKKPPPRAEQSVSVDASACTDNFRLCLYSAMARPDCPLHWVHDVGRIIKLMTSLRECHLTSDSGIVCSLSWAQSEYTQLLAQLYHRSILTCTQTITT